MFYQVKDSSGEVVGKVKLFGPHPGVAPLLAEVTRELEILFKTKFKGKLWMDVERGFKVIEFNNGNKKYELSRV